MSSSSKDANALLQIRTGDAAAEIFIVNEKLDTIHHGLGESLNARLPLGIYKTKVRSGSQIEERLVVLSEPEKTVVQEFSPVNFASAAPLHNTSLTHEFHVYNAETESQKIHQEIGKGSMIYLFVRDWTMKQRPNIEPDSQNPARGLTLHDRDGALLIDFEQAAAKQGGWEPWAACNVELNPGIYRLRLEIADGTQIEQTIVAAPQWQTQIFLLQRDYDERGEDRRADPAGAAILMRALKGNKQVPWSNYGFSADDEGFRLDEQARLALAKGRQILSKRLRNDLLHGKFENPMLGIYGAHLLLADKEFDKKLLETVVRNLRRLLVLPHPDVEALALKFENEAGNNYIFDQPPMLRRSWAIIVEATAEQPWLISENSLADEVATRLWGPEPLLLWVEQTAESRENETEQIAAENLDDYEFILKERLKRLRTPRVAASHETQTESSDTEESESWSNKARWRNRSSSETAMSEADSVDFDFDRNATSEAVASEDTLFDQAENLREETGIDFGEIVTGVEEEVGTESAAEYVNLIPELIKSLGVPRTTVENMLKRVQNSD